MCVCVLCNSHYNGSVCVLAQVQETPSSSVSSSAEDHKQTLGKFSPVSLCPVDPVKLSSDAV